MSDIETNISNGEGAALAKPASSIPPPTNSSTNRAAILYPDDVKADEVKAEAEKASEEKAAIREGAESYDIKLPEGVDLDGALLKEATPVFRELGLTSAQASRLAPLAMKVQERMIEQQNDEFAGVRADWARQAKADPDIGGSNFTESVRLSAVALEAAGAGAAGSELRKLLDDSGLGNHPAFIRAFRNIGRRLRAAGRA